MFHAGGVAAASVSDTGGRRWPATAPLQRLIYPLSVMVVLKLTQESVSTTRISFHMQLWPGFAI